MLQAGFTRKGHFETLGSTSQRASRLAAPQASSGAYCVAHRHDPGSVAAPVEMQPVHGEAGKLASEHLFDVVDLRGVRSLRKMKPRGGVPAGVENAAARREQGGSTR
jgi:hypothetical protein